MTTEIVSAFHDKAPAVSTHLIASLAASPQPELEGTTPADWITTNQDSEPVVLAAQRAAHLEAM